MTNWSELPEDGLHLLEVHGLDLLAQTEAMLRSARAYQAALRHLRDSAGVGERGRDPVAVVRASVAQMAETCARLGDTLDDIRKIVGSPSG